MATRNRETERTSADLPAPETPRSTTPDTMERRVVAFAEQLGRMAGTLQARAEGWMDQETLSRNISSVRDAAVQLLQQLAGVFQRSLRVVDGARTDHHQQAVVLAGDDVVHCLAGLADQRFDGSAPNREKADEVFGWGKHGDVLDAFVVGLAGLLDGRIPAVAGGGGFGIHRRLPFLAFVVFSDVVGFEKFANEEIGRGKKKPPEPGGFWRFAA